MEIAKEKKRSFFYCLFCPKEIFFNIQVLSQCIVYWIRFRNIHACTYQKTLLHAFFCLFLKSSNTFSVSLSLFLLYFIKLFLKRFEKNCLTLARLQELMFFKVMSVPIQYNKKFYLFENYLRKLVFHLTFFPTLQSSF